ncbi:hypothetical protein JCM8547_005485 [Rhodosporidiobolus lusitaniae]
MASAHAHSLFVRPADGFTFAYKVLGRSKAGPPFVLIHGLSSVGLVDWFPLATSLAEHRPVLVFDNRGIGSSRIPKGKEKERYDVQDMADDVVELVKHLGFREIDLLGFSMGGMIAQTLLVTLHLPFTVRHAILVATSAKPAHSDLLQAIPSPPADGKVLTTEEKKELIRPFILTGYDPAFIRTPRNQALIDQRIEETVQSRRPARVIQQQVRVIADYDVRKRLGTIPPSLPVLVIQGSLDRSVYPTESKYILAGIKHAQFLSFEGMGHIWYDYLDATYWTNLLNRFLADEEVASLVPPSLAPPPAKL